MLVSMYVSTGLSFKYPSRSTVPNILTDGSDALAEPLTIILPLNTVLPRRVLLPT
jgi:hypothetical protein